MSNKLSLEARCLGAMISSDPTRYHLQVIHMDENLEKAVSTDAYRMFCSKEVYSNERKGKSFNGRIFQKECEFLEVKDVKFPNISQFTPKSNFKGSLSFKVPTYFEKIKAIAKNNPVYIINHLNEGIVSLSLPKEIEFVELCFDARLIAPFAGVEVILLYRDKLSPFLVLPIDTKLETVNVEEAKTEFLAPDYKKLSWFSVIMPMRI